MRPSRIGRRWSRVMLCSGLLVMGALAARVGAADAEPNRVYDANCALCHQKAGVGLRGQFPRLAGRVNEIGARPAGRRYLMEVVLFGMAGTVQVDGASILGVMPPFVALTDDDLAAALNYIISLDGPAQGSSGTQSKHKPPLITAADIKVVRSGQQLSPTQVHVNREAIMSSPHR